jgi:hypothetical protein
MTHSLLPPQVDAGNDKPGQPGVGLFSEVPFFKEQIVITLKDPAAIKAAEQGIPPDGLETSTGASAVAATDDGGDDTGGCVELRPWLLPSAWPHCRSPAGDPFRLALADDIDREKDGEGGGDDPKDSAAWRYSEASRCDDWHRMVNAERRVTSKALMKSTIKCQRPQIAPDPKEMPHLVNPRELLLIHARTAEASSLETPVSSLTAYAVARTFVPVPAVVNDLPDYGVGPSAAYTTPYAYPTGVGLTDAGYRPVAASLTGSTSGHDYPTAAPMSVLVAAPQPRPPSPPQQNEWPPTAQAYQHQAATKAGYEASAWMAATDLPTYAPYRPPSPPPPLQQQRHEQPHLQQLPQMQQRQQQQPRYATTAAPPPTYRPPSPPMQPPPASSTRLPQMREPNSRATTLCKYWVRNGRCGFGADCHFSHRPEFKGIGDESALLVPRQHRDDRDRSRDDREARGRDERDRSRGSERDRDRSRDLDRDRQRERGRQRTDGDDRQRDDRDRSRRRAPSDPDNGVYLRGSSFNDGGDSGWAARR